MKKILAVLVAVSSLVAREPLAQRIVHTDSSKYRPSPSVHGGPGKLDYMALLDYHSLDTNLFFLHRGTIDPKSGIGHHFHNNCEEMFVIFDGEAQFTVDGRTSTLKGPAGAPCRMGHSHAIYNPTDKPVQWMNINVSALKGEYDAFDLKDGRKDVQLDPIPVFMTMSLDRALLPTPEDGGAQFRRALVPSVFAGPWSYVDHMVLPAKASSSPHSHRATAEFYYVMSGEGTVTVGGAGRGAMPETAQIKTGDAIPIQINDIHSFQNTGGQPLEFLIVGVARTPQEKGVDTPDVQAGGRGGRGNR